MLNNVPQTFVFPVFDLFLSNMLQTILNTVMRFKNKINGFKRIAKNQQQRESKKQ